VSTIEGRLLSKSPLPFRSTLDEQTCRIDDSVSERPIQRGAARQASPFGAGLKPHSIRSSLDWANEFTSVEFLVFHVSITERTLSALLSRVSIYSRSVGVMTRVRLRNSRPPRKCCKTIGDSSSSIKEVLKRFPVRNL
jgi:hypothetical protein